MAKKPSKILVDSSVWISWSRGRNAGMASRLDAMLEQSLEITTIDPIVLEVLAGCSRSQDWKTMREMFQHLESLPLDRSTHERASLLYQRLRSKGVQPGGTADCLIAQVCLDHGASLLSLDKDFERMTTIVPLTLA